ncbi:MAG: YegP family protein [Planctomycetota bacterium]
MAKFEVYQDKKGEYRWRLKSSNGQNIANGGEGYVAKADCLNGIESVKKNSQTADIVELPKED